MRFLTFFEGLHWAVRLFVVINAGFALINLGFFALGGHHWQNLLSGVTSALVAGFLLISEWQNQKHQQLMRELMETLEKLEKANRLAEHRRITRTW